jgi:hypothetical protein
MFGVDRLAMIFPSSNGLLPDGLFKRSSPSCGPAPLTASTINTLPASHGYFLLSEFILSSSHLPISPLQLQASYTGVEPAFLFRDLCRYYTASTHTSIMMLVSRKSSKRQEATTATFVRCGGSEKIIDGYV